jgi:hypothetical protein
MMLRFILENRQGKARLWLQISHVGIRYSSMNPFGVIGRQIVFIPFTDSWLQLC